MSEELRIPISASVRHIHLCRKDVEALFGAGHQLTPAKALSQPGQFACEETVTVCGPKGRLERVRVLGPERQETQLEISRTDEFKLGIDAPIRASGKLEGTPGIRLEGPEGVVELKKGVIQAARHIHMTPADAERLGVEDRQWVMVRVGAAGCRFLAPAASTPKKQFLIIYHHLISPLRSQEDLSRFPSAILLFFDWSRWLVLGGFSCLRHHFVIALNNYSN